MTTYSLDLFLAWFGTSLLSTSGSNCCFLICIEVSQEAGKVIWYSHLFKNFPQFVVIYTVRGFGVINNPEVDVFLELSCFFNDPTDVCNLISDSSAFSKTSLNIWKFSAHVLLKPSLENFEHYLASIVLYSTGLYFHHHSHPQLSIVCFGSISSFFLELFLQSFPVAYWAPTDLGSSSFSVISFCLFVFSWGSQGKNTEVVCHSLLQQTTFCQNSPPWPVCLRWPYTAWLIVSLR